MWNGSLSGSFDPRIDGDWCAADFEAIAASLGPVYFDGHAYHGLAYVGGEADAAVIKEMAAEWNVLPCLDVEGSIRAYGDWVQAWLDEAGTCGIYGVSSVHGVRASFHVMAFWTANPTSASWPYGYNHPGTPCGWQWAGNVAMIGDVVDRNVFDDSFKATVASIPTTPPIHSAGDEDMARLVTAGVRPTTEGQDPHGNGAVYLTNEFVKRWVPSGAVDAQYIPTYGPVQTINAYVIDSIPEMPDLSKRVDLAPSLFVPVTLPDAE
jgi:hypothetical protein